MTSSTHPDVPTQGGMSFPDAPTAVVLARMEGKLDNTLSSMREQGRRIGALEQDMATAQAAEARQDRDAATLAQRVTTVERDQTRTESRLDNLPTAQRATVVTLIAAAGLVVSVVTALGRAL